MVKSEGAPRYNSGDSCYDEQRQERSTAYDTQNSDFFQAGPEEREYPWRQAKYDLSTSHVAFGEFRCVVEQAIDQGIYRTGRLPYSQGIIEW